MMRKLNVGVDSFLFCNVLSLYSIVSSRAEDGALVVALYAGAQRFMLLWWCRCLAICRSLQKDLALAFPHGNEKKSF